MGTEAEIKAFRLHAALAELLARYKNLIRDTSSEPTFGEAAGTMTRHHRSEFTNATKREAYARSGGVCECHRVRQLPGYGEGCGVKLSEGNTFYEHIEQDYFTSDNSLDNCAVLTRTCWKLKTAAADLPAIAKSKRLRDRGRGIRKTVFKPRSENSYSGSNTSAAGFARITRGDRGTDRA